MDVRPGGSSSCRTDPDHHLGFAWRGASSQPYEELATSGELAKPWPQPVSNSLWRSRYQLYHRRRWVLSIRK